jgi:ferritin-like metal-binding protein YciE
MSIETAQDLFIEELKDIYSAEKQAVRAYPRFAQAVESEDLKEALQQHLEQTKGQVQRLEQVFEILKKRAAGKTCEGMKGLLEEATQHLEEIEPGPVLDAALIGALQRVEHYEIAAYGTVANFAEATGESEIQQLLASTLQEEKDTDEKLTEISTSVNEEAIGTGEEDDDEEFDEDDEDDEDDEEGEDDDEEEEEEEEMSESSQSTSAKSTKKKSTR